MRSAVLDDADSHRILAALYLRGAVARARLLARACGEGAEEPARIREMERALSRLRERGMLVDGRGEVRLTPLGGKAAYALACASDHPLRDLLGCLGWTHPGGGRMLDLGCGPGNYLADAVEMPGAPSMVLGLDRDLDSLNLSQDRLRRHGARACLVCGEAERLPFRAASFDDVVCAVVLPYVREERCLAEAARVLRPGGRMIISAHGPGYYLGLLFGRDVTLKRRLFGLASLAGTAPAHACRIKLPGARYQSARRIAKTLSRQGVKVERIVRRGRCLGLTQWLGLAAIKQGAG